MDKEAADELDSVGVTTIQLLDPVSLYHARNHFLQTLSTFPEFKESNTRVQYSFDAGGTLNNPASFHNECARALRLAAHPRVVSLLNQIDHENRYVEQLIDRMCVVQSTDITLQQPSSPSSTSSTTPPPPPQPLLVKEDGDVFFRGWINLDMLSHEFSFVVGSHRPYRKNQTNGQRRSVRVHPGQLILYHDTLQHDTPSCKSYKVKSGKMAPSFRLLVAFRLTFSQKALYSYELAGQGIVPLPDGNMPSMIPLSLISMPESSTRTKMIRQVSRWSRKTFRTKCTSLTNICPRRIVHQHMKSLADYEFRRYRRYSQNERGILHPAKKWTWTYENSKPRSKTTWDKNASLSHSWSFDRFLSLLKEGSQTCSECAVVGRPF